MASHQKELTKKQKIVIYIFSGITAFTAAVIAVLLFVKAVKNPPNILTNSATSHISMASNITSSHDADITESANTSNTDMLIQGISDGVTYYTTQYAYFTDPNIKIVTVNGEESGKAFYIKGNSDDTYLIKATDNSGYTVTYTVYTKKINSLTENLTGLNQFNVTADDSDTINSVKNTILEISTKYSSTKETNALDEILMICDNLLKKISQVQDEFARITTKASEYVLIDSDIKDINIAEITTVSEDINALLSSENLTYTQRSELKVLMQKCEFWILSTTQSEPYSLDTE